MIVEKTFAEQQQQQTVEIKPRHDSDANEVKGNVNLCVFRLKSSVFPLFP